LDSSQVNGSSPSFHKIVDGKFMERRGPYQLIYTVDPVLQASVEGSSRPQTAFRCSWLSNRKGEDPGIGHTP
jgi:hypothetical protein